MEQINNLDTIRECSRVLGHQVENTPQLDTSKIILTSEVNSRLLRKTNFIKSVLKSGNGTTTTAISSELDTFLTGILISSECDILCDGTFVSASFSPEGASNTDQIIIGKIPLSKSKTDVFIPFNNPIKLTKGTNVGVSNSTITVGSCVTRIGFFGYTTETQQML
jgi:hypothetical protein